MKTRTVFLLSAIVIASAAPAVPAEPEIYSSVCDDPAGGQTFYLQEKIEEGRHSSLDIAKVDMLPQGGIYRLLVFSAAPEGIHRTDASLSTELVLTFSSNSDQYNMIAGAMVTLATEGETGPIIEGFGFRHDDGRELQIVDESEPVVCRTVGRSAE